MTADTGRVLVFDVVGLQPHHVTVDTMPAMADLLDAVVATRPAFPALTVPAQSTLATGTDPTTHGDVASGRYDRATDTVEFWGRDRPDRQRLWEAAREAGATTGALFFQHLIGTDADVAVTPSPIEDADNNLIEMDCWTNPDDFYDDLRDDLGHFPLHNYWGPTASVEATRWILAAAERAVDRVDPDLLWVYVPHLDYTGLAEGPGDAFEAELSTVDTLIGEFLEARRADDRWDETAVAVVSEYGFNAVDTPIFPNRALREAGLLSVVDDGEGGEEVDLDASAAFAMVDHQIAHVYVDADARAAAHAALDRLPKVDAVLTAEEDALAAHPNAGDFVLVADRDAWFQYYWWDDDEDAPFYATGVDIHRKPGFDPCELFFGEEGLVSLDPTKVGGSHGRVDPETFPVFGVGGPAAPALPEGPVDARTVTPTLADLLGVANDSLLNAEGNSLLSE
ncbi:alkaline phosphatase family protein [Natronomonas sp.]|uniref:alkaline phosphatase family protein n=1 Tax=Natronomonas sp. TaxID=2184060 RepID=UPI0039764C90